MAVKVTPSILPCCTLWPEGTVQSEEERELSPPHYMSEKTEAQRRCISGLIALRGAQGLKLRCVWLKTTMLLPQRGPGILEDHRQGPSARGTHSPC